jgi:poly-gamma-glutamate synthase PgsB/CapB
MAMTLVFLLLSTAMVFAFLVLERAGVNRRRKAIPLRITVTGTRGKSSVTRMLAAVLRESGRRVLAKTTGSEAALILPDGSERAVRRRGHPSILEQKHFIHRAADLGVDVAVAEIMSIHAENHLVETRHLLAPHVVLLTNLRADHTGAMGETPEEVAAVLALDVPPGARVFVPQQACLPQLRGIVRESGGELIEVPAGTTALPFDMFGENHDLVWAAARSLGIDDRHIEAGMRRSQGDIGALRIWRYRPAGTANACFLVNAFGANDPESTMLVHRKVMAALGADPTRCVGLITLRADRGDRTLQWAKAMAEGLLNRFSRLYVRGLHAAAFKRRLRRSDGAERVEVLRHAGPARVTETVLSGIQELGGVVFGFGNIGGKDGGGDLVKHWELVGEPFATEP